MRSIAYLALLVVALATSAAPVLASSGGAASAPAIAVARKSCTPGYSPCIPNKPSDVDCWGGSGNGPRYTPPTRPTRSREVSTDTASMSTATDLAASLTGDSGRAGIAC